MRRPPSLPRLAAAAVGLLLATIGVAVVGGPPARDAAPTAAVPAAPRFAGPVGVAGTGTALVLHPDPEGGRVRGWVAGGSSFAGRTVTATYRGAKSTAEVRRDNTFDWPIPAQPAAAKDDDAAGRVAFTLPADAAPVEGSVTLPPPAAAGGKSVFFVTDRTAYRPGHTVKFAGFVRRMTAAGEFEPADDAEVTVDLTSKTRGTRAARLNSRR